MQIAYHSPDLDVRIDPLTLDALRRAIRSAGQPGRCAHCGRQVRTSAPLCYVCDRAPLETREGWDAIDRLRAAQLRQEGGAR